VIFKAWKSHLKFDAPHQISKRQMHILLKTRLLGIMHGGKKQIGKIPAIQIEFDDALPPRKPNKPALESSECWVSNPKFC
jgi:hypothetical protein